MAITLNSNIPSGAVGQKWSKYKQDAKLVNPANKRKYEVIVVGTGLAGAAAAASLSELGYGVKAFCYQDSARRAIDGDERCVARDDAAGRGMERHRAATGGDRGVAGGHLHAGATPLPVALALWPTR